MGLKAQTRIIEALLSLIIVLLFILLLNRMILRGIQTVYKSELRDIACRVLSSMAEKEILYRIAYGDDGRGFPSAAMLYLDQNLPPRLGYNLTVLRYIDGKWVKVFSIASKGYVPGKASSISMVLTGYKQWDEIRVIILSLSGD